MNNKIFSKYGSMEQSNNMITDTRYIEEADKVVTIHISKTGREYWEHPDTGTWKRVISKNQEILNLIQEKLLTKLNKGE